MQIRPLLIAPILIVGICAGGLASEDRAVFEQPPTLVASEILPTELLVSDHHRVDEGVCNDGYLNTFRIVSDFGDFEATGEAMLAVRVWEVQALAQLDALSKTKVFADAVKGFGKDQVDAVVGIVSHPIATVKGIPSGVGRMFKRYRRNVTDGIHVVKEVSTGGGGDVVKQAGVDLDGNAMDVADDLLKTYLDVDDAQREWAERLGTDPYTSNETLRAAIEEVAWVDRVTKYGLRLAGAPTIPGYRHVRRLNKMVWEHDPRELRDLNMARLLEAGAEEALVTAFFANPSLSPTEQTRFVELLSRLGEVPGRASLIERASLLESEEQARFFMLSLNMLLWCHGKAAPVEAIVESPGIPIAQVEGGRIIVFAAVDHLCWTEEIAELARERTTESGAGRFRREIWLFGTASQRCHNELSKLGWTVHSGLRAHLAELLSTFEETPNLTDPPSS